MKIDIERRFACFLTITSLVSVRLVSLWLLSSYRKISVEFYARR